MKAPLSLLLGLFLCNLTFAQTSYPMITHISPVAVQRGTSVEVLVEGQMNFVGIDRVLFEGVGVKGTALPGVKPKTPTEIIRKTTIKVEVDATAPLGVREFRLASPMGISTLGQLLIVDYPVTSESGDNNTREKAQIVGCPSVVTGRIEIAEDVDFFRFPAKAGTPIHLEIHSARLQDKIHDLQKHADPILTVFDSTGKEIAGSDDVAFADPRLTFTPAKDGDYFVQVRDAKYDGDPRWVYALTITNKPRVTLTYPLAVAPNSKTELEPIGSARSFLPKVLLETPKETGWHSIPLKINQESTNPTPIYVTSLPIINESEPNDDVKTAQKVVYPCVINGKIQKARDKDVYSLKATKGKTIRFEVFARRFGTDLISPLDGVFEILSATGSVLQSIDDTIGKDPALSYTPTVDGEIFVRIRDLHSRGGDAFVYALSIDDAKPNFTLKCDPSKAMIGQGGCSAWFVQLVRNDGFTGPVKVEVKGLPKGVSVNPLTIPANMTQGLLVLNAAKDAPLTLSPVEIVGSAEVEFAGKKSILTQPCVAVEEIYLPGGGRGRFDVRMQTIAVCEPLDIIEIVAKPEKLVLKPGDEIKIDVTIKRRADYDKTVTIDVPLRHLGSVFGSTLPPGVTLVEGKSKTGLGTGNTGHIVLKVAPDAPPCDDVPISIQAFASINFVVKVGYSSPVIPLTIQKK